MRGGGGGGGGAEERGEPGRQMGVGGFVITHQCSESF